MSEIKFGDLFELVTSKGKVYFQYIFETEQKIQLIRILPDFYPERPNNFSEVINKKELYYVHFPLKPAYRKKLVEYVGNYEIPSQVMIPEHMRSQHNIRGEMLGWHIINTETWQRDFVKNLTDKQKELSPWGIWNDTLLKERIEEEWTLEEWY